MEAALIRDRSELWRLSREYPDWTKPQFAEWLEREVGNYLDDLDMVLVLLTRVEMLYDRLGKASNALANPGEADYR